VIAIISESRSASVRNRDRHHLGTLIAIARNTHDGDEDGVLQVHAIGTAQNVGGIVRGGDPS
jgi:hypothetical protein